MSNLVKLDGKILGVCESYGVWLGIDPLILRVIFLISFFGFGTGFLVYIILWLVLLIN